MKRILFAALVILMSTSSPASAQITYGIWNNGPLGQSLITFPVSSPTTFTTIGPTGIPAANFVNSLEFDGSGNLFTATNSATGYFFSVNQATGAATLIGGSGLAAGDSLGDLSFDRVNNRMLGIGTAGVAGSGARLYSINTSTGAATNLGSITNFTDGFTVSLAVRPSDGRIFAHGIETDRWYSIDPTTLAATQLGPLNFNTNFGQGGSFDPATGTLYHAMLYVDPVLGNQGRFLSIDPVTGAPTVIGNLGVGLQQVGDIAFAPVPEPTSLALVGLIASAWFVRRRSKRAAIAPSA